MYPGRAVGRRCIEESTFLSLSLTFVFFSHCFLLFIIDFFFLMDVYRLFSSLLFTSLFFFSHTHFIFLFYLFVLLYPPFFCPYNVSVFIFSIILSPSLFLYLPNTIFFFLKRFIVHIFPSVSPSLYHSHSASSSSSCSRFL